MTRSQEVRLVESLIEPLETIVNELLKLNNLELSKAVNQIKIEMKDYLESQGY